MTSHNEFCQPYCIITRHLQLDKKKYFRLISPCSSGVNCIFNQVARPQSIAQTARATLAWYSFVAAASTRINCVATVPCCAFECKLFTEGGTHIKCTPRLRHSTAKCLGLLALCAERSLPPLRVQRKQSCN